MLTLNKNLQISFLREKVTIANLCVQDSSILIQAVINLIYPKRIMNLLVFDNQSSVQM